MTLSVRPNRPESWWEFPWWDGRGDCPQTNDYEPEAESPLPERIPKKHLTTAEGG